MKLKLDENLGKREKNLLRAAGHDAVGTREEGLGGAADPEILAACVREARVLIILDRGFGNVLRFPPQHTCGIVVLATPDPLGPDSILARLEDFLASVAARSLGRELWIVEPGRIRIHESESPGPVEE